MNIQINIINSLLIPNSNVIFTMSWKFKLTHEEYTSLIESFRHLELFEKYQPNFEKHTYHTPRIIQDKNRPKSSSTENRGKNGFSPSLSDDEFCRLYLQPRKLKLGAGREKMIKLNPMQESKFNRAFRKEYRRRKEREEAREREKRLNRSWSWETGANGESNIRLFGDLNGTWSQQWSNGVDSLNRSEHSAFQPTSSSASAGAKQQADSGRSRLSRQNGLASSDGSTGSDGAAELPADSHFVHVGTPKSPLDLSHVLPEKYLTSTGSTLEKDYQPPSSFSHVVPKINGHGSAKPQKAPKPLLPAASVADGYYQPRGLSVYDDNNVSGLNGHPIRSASHADERPIRSAHADSRAGRSKQHHVEDGPIRSAHSNQAVSSNNRPIRSADDRPIRAKKDNEQCVDNDLEADESKTKETKSADDRPIRPSYSSTKPKKSSRTERKTKDTHTRRSHSSSKESNQSLDKSDRSIDRSHDQAQPIVCHRCQESVSQSEHLLQTSSTVPSSGSSILAVCTNLLQKTVNRQKGQKSAESFVDKILSNSECVKVSIITILDAFTTATEAKQDVQALFCTSSSVQQACVSLAGSLELLLSHASLWADTLADSMDSPHVTAQVSTVTKLATELSTEALLFLKSCHDNDESTAQDAASRCIDLLFDLVAVCGEVAIATETRPTVLRDAAKQRQSLADLIAMSAHAEDEDVMAPRPGVDLKQSFLGGCGGFVDRAVQSVLRTVDEAEDRMQRLVDSCQKCKQENSDSSKHCYIVMVTVKALVVRCKEVQSQLDVAMKEDSDSRPSHYYHLFYERCQGLITQLNHLADSVSLLSQAAAPLDQDNEPGTLRKVCRCTEIVSKAITKLSSVSEPPPSPLQSSHSLSSLNGLSIELRTRTPTSSKTSASTTSNTQPIILSATQREQLQQATNDVTFATTALIGHVKARLPITGDGTAGGKVKRMLPIPPGGNAGKAAGGEERGRTRTGSAGGSGRRILRCQSAKARISRNVSMADLSTSSIDV